MDKYKEAIQAIKANWPPSNYTMLRDALNLAVEALEKQMSKKIERRKGPANVEYWSCPACGRIYWEKDHIDNYCGSCGQELEWGDK